MMSDLKSTDLKIALVWSGDREARDKATLEGSHFAALSQALRAVGLVVEPAIYADEFAEEVRRQLLQVHGALVWVNPIAGSQDRTVLDALLRDVASSGVFVSAHPEVILKMGTKEVLFQTRDIGWGSDTHLYTGMEELRQQLPLRLAHGGARVLKQHRGNNGIGVWKVERSSDSSEMTVRIRHAQRGCVEEEVSLVEFFERCEPYFKGSGRMIDQPYQERLAEGMIRCYLVHDRVAGFGHQAINALFPAPPGAPSGDAPQPGPRLYHPPTKVEFQSLKRKLEQEWIPAMQRTLGIETKDLPVIWDADFLYGPKTSDGEDTYVLCEINVSAVSPFPEHAIPQMVQAAASAVRSAKDKAEL